MADLSCFHQQVNEMTRRVQDMKARLVEPNGNGVKIGAYAVGIVNIFSSSVITEPKILKVWAAHQA